MKGMTCFQRGILYRYEGRISKEVKKTLLRNCFPGYYLGQNDHIILWKGSDNIDN